MTDFQKQSFLAEVNKLHERNLLSGTVAPDYYEPGMMEYLDKSDGRFDPETGGFTIRFEIKGTRYEGRTEQIEHVCAGDPLMFKRDPGNKFNPCNFYVCTPTEINLGSVPAALCNAIAPLYDEGSLTVSGCSVSYVEPISRRNKHAKQAMLFAELTGRLK